MKKERPFKSLFVNCTQTWEVVLLKKRNKFVFECWTLLICFVPRTEKRIFFNVRTLHIWQYSSNSIHHANKEKEVNLEMNKKKNTSKIFPWLKMNPNTLIHALMFPVHYFSMVGILQNQYDTISVSLLWLSLRFSQHVRVRWTKSQNELQFVNLLPTASITYQADCCANS